MATNITALPSAKVPVVFGDSLVMTTEWYRFFNNLYGIIGNGQSIISVANGGTGQSSYTDGQLLIGNSIGNTLTKNTLTADVGIGIDNGHGTIKIRNEGVTSLIAGANITLSGNTGKITISSTGAGGNITSNAVVATQNQTVFTVTKYDVGANTLEVYVNGNKQIANINYEETDNVTVTFLTGLNLNDLVEFRIIGSLANDLSGVTGVTATTPLYSSGGSTPNISLIGNIPVANLNSGTGASNTTYWRGDGTWASLPAFALPGGNNTWYGSNTFTGGVAIGSAALLGANTINSQSYNFTAGTAIYRDPSSGSVVISDGTGQFEFTTAGQVYANTILMLTAATGARLASPNTLTALNNFTGGLTIGTATTSGVNTITSQSYNFTPTTALYRDPVSGSVVISDGASGQYEFTNTGILYINGASTITAASATTFTALNRFTGGLAIGSATSAGANTITSQSYNFTTGTAIYRDPVSGSVVISDGASGQYEFTNTGIFYINGAPVLTTATGAQLASANTLSALNNFTGGLTIGTASSAGANTITSQSYNFTAGTAIYRDPGTGVVNISNGTGQFNFNTSGQAYNTTGTWGTISDARVKENIAPAHGYLDSLCQLEVVNYNLIDRSDKLLGFVAQQVEQVMPGLVDTNANDEFNLDDLKSIKTSVLIPMLVKAVQELKAQVDELKAK